MAKTSKPKASETVPSVVSESKVTPKGKAAAAAASAAAPVVASAPTTVPAVVAASGPVVAEVKVKAPRKKAAPKVVDETPVVPVQASSSSENVIISEEASSEVLSTETTYAAQSLEFISKLNQLSIQISSLKSEYKALEKKFAKELKASTKSGKKRKRTGNRAPSGFVKPTLISKELASFLEKPEGTEMARTAVTREINTYIRSHNLQDKSNGRKINPDSKLSILLDLAPTDELTYFNLQRFMSKHFKKNAKPETPEVVSASATF